MLKLEWSAALALIFCSATALARDPQVLGTIAPFQEGQTRTLHRLPLEADAPAAVDLVTVEPKATRAASDGLLSPFIAPAVIPKFQAHAQSYAGYDGAASGARARGVVEGKLTNFLALRAEFEHGPATGTADRLSLGARVGILTQRQYGIDLGAGLFYQPKDFRAEGNFVGGLMVARHFERLGLFANALFGSDPEGDDQSLDLRLGSLYTASNWLSLGFDARSRMGFSQDQKRLGTRSVDWELQAAPTAIFCLGQFSLMTLFGPSVLKETPAAAEASRDSRTRVGLLAMAGMGGAF